MHTAAAIVRHALQMLLQDPRITLRVISPALILLAGVGITTFLAAPSLLTMRHEPVTADSLLVAPLILGFMAGYGLMAMLWHRHALHDADVRPFGLRLFVRYMGRVLLLGIIQLGFSIAIVIPLLLGASFGQNEGPGPSVFAILMTTFLTQLLLIWVSLRLSLILPAAALGAPLAIAESWRKTAALTRPLWGVAAILAGFNTVLTVLIGLIDMRTPLLALIVELPIYVLQGMLIFGILTTLYAHLVQNSVAGRTPGTGGLMT